MGKGKAPALRSHHLPLLHVPPSRPGCWCRDCLTDPVAFEPDGRGLCQFHVPLELLSPDGPTIHSPAKP